ncbi:MAG: glycosyltransferase family 2 protein [Anaerolineae bacterium]|nr:glycosyltransferase family 2 protein [Anaerolineae bacterium]
MASTSCSGYIAVCLPSAIIAPLMMRILAITLNWRQPQLTLECVQALRSLHTHVDILVIDNGSGDNSAEILAAGLAPAELVCLPNNVGFAAGSNHGLRYAIEQGYTYALLLNNDAFPSADMLDQLLAETSDDTALLTPVIYYEAQPNRIWYGGARRHKHTLDLRDRLQNQIDSGQITTHDVDYVLGTCVLVNLAAVAKVGLLDERYFMYFEDLDWSLRFQSAGYRLRLVASAKLYHRVAVSTGGVESPLRRFYLARSSVIFYRVHRDAGTTWIIVLFRIGSAMKTLAKLAWHRQWEAARAYVHGLHNGWIASRQLVSATSVNE